MTKYQMMQIYYLKKEKGMWERKAKELETIAEAKGQVITGMPIPKTNAVRDVIGDMVTAIEEAEENVNRIQQEIDYWDAVITSRITKMPDSMLRQIFFYRCIELDTWERIAATIGGDNTAASVKMMFHRCFNENGNLIIK